MINIRLTSVINQTSPLEDMSSVLFGFPVKLIDRHLLKRKNKIDPIKEEIKETYVEDCH